MINKRIVWIAPCCGTAINSGDSDILYCENCRKGFYRNHVDYATITDYRKRTPIDDIIDILGKGKMVRYHKKVKRA
jgi:hypothetical protein